LVLLVLMAPDSVGSSQPYVREVERLREDLHKLVSRRQDRGVRMAVNGRVSPFVDITERINRLLHLDGERAAPAVPAAPADPYAGLFIALAATLPEVALIHTDTILFATPDARGLIGVDAATLVGKPIADLMRPAYRALMRKHIADHLEASDPLQPVEVQLISDDDRGLWVELYSKRLVFQGKNAFLTVAHDITRRKSLEASL